MRIAHFIGFYNFQRTHQGIDGLVPADRFFEASNEVRAALEAARGAERPGAGAATASRGSPSISRAASVMSRVSLHSEGDRVLLTDERGVREEVDLQATGKRGERADEEAPGTSVLDEVVKDLEALDEDAANDDVATEGGA